MLILQRKPGENVMIGDDISISIVSVEGSRVRIAISAPKEVPILRGELLETQKLNRAAAAEVAAPEALLDLLGHQGLLPRTEPESEQKP